MNRTSRHTNEILTLAVLAFITFLSRLPFLNNGFGYDPDAWRIMRSAHLMAATGTYRVSRFPGYPLVEIVYSWLWPSSPFVTNGLTAVMSVIAVSFFALICKHLGSKDYFIAGLALAFTPIIFINSTNSMEYMWALAFILAGMYFIMRNRPLTAGLFCGLAVGSRLTSLFMLIPFCVLILGQAPPRKSQWIAIIKLIVPAFVVSSIIYIPVIQNYGFEFLTFYDSSQTVAQAIYRMGVGTWGNLGLVAIFTGCMTLLIYPTFFNNSQRSIPGTLPEFYMRSWVFVIFIYLILFMRLPLESGYLIPIIPFVILLFARFLNRYVFILLSVLMILSSFIAIQPPHFENGPIIKNQTNRQIRSENLKQILGAVNEIQDEKAVIVLGWMLPQAYISRILENSQNTSSAENEYFLMESEELDAFLNEGIATVTDNTKVRYVVFLLDSDQLKVFLEHGFSVYIESGQTKFNESAREIDLLKHGAQLLIKEEKE